MSEITCPFCGSGGKTTRFSTGIFKVYQCKFCTLGFLYPVPTQTRLMYGKEYFKNDKLFSGYDNYEQMGCELEKESSARINYIKRFSSRKNRLLDVGSGLGVFAKSAKDKGYNVDVLDISRYVISLIRKKFGIRGYTNDLSVPFSIKVEYEILTAWDALEHVTDINCAFENLNRLLKKGGYLFFTTPNLGALETKFFGNNWYGFKKIPEHIFYMTPTFVKIISEAHGFEVIKIKRSGFYRSLGFIASKVFYKNATLRGLVEDILVFLGLKSLIVYFPAVDMMCILRKKSEL